MSILFRVTRVARVVIDLAIALLGGPHAWRQLYFFGQAVAAASRAKAPFRISWAQDGEDLYLVDALPDKGFYVDVGAHHPLRFSVTHALYVRGWRGINIDFTENFESLFSRFRPKDTNVKALIGPHAEVTYYRFNEEALNTTVRQIAEDYQSAGWSIRDSQTISSQTLSEVLTRENAPREIQLLCIDVEGADLEVLKTIDFLDWQVENVLVEVNSPSWQIDKTEIGRYLSKFGFRPQAVFFRSALFSRSKN